MNPQNVAKIPIRRSMYLAWSIPLREGKLSQRTSFIKHNTHAVTSKIIPSPMSPNITPNRKGKVTVVKIAGLTSL
jgi:hypothetical protein